MNTLKEQLIENGFKDRTDKVICPYCDRPAKLVGGKEIYPSRFDLYKRKFWLCVFCNAYVGTHKGGTKPYGRLANKQLRAIRKDAHNIFDKIWKSDKMKRLQAYGWLANSLGIKVKNCHIGDFDIETCEKVIKLSLKWMVHNGQSD